MASWKASIASGELEVTGTAVWASLSAAAFSAAAFSSAAFFAAASAAAFSSAAFFAAASAATWAGSGLVSFPVMQDAESSKASDAPIKRSVMEETSSGAGLRGARVPNLPRRVC